MRGSLPLRLHPNKSQWIWMGCGTYTSASFFYFCPYLYHWMAIASMFTIFWLTFFGRQKHKLLVIKTFNYLIIKVDEWYIIEKKSILLIRGKLSLFKIKWPHIKSALHYKTVVRHFCYQIRWKAWYYSLYKRVYSIRRHTIMVGWRKN